MHMRPENFQAIYFTIKSILIHEYHQHKSTRVDTNQHESTRINRYQQESNTSQHEFKTGPRQYSSQNLRAIKQEALLFNKSI